MTALEETTRLTRRQRKAATKQQNNHQQNKPKGLYLTSISPITDNQEKTFDAFSYGKHLLLHGSAGTGKTFISLYLSLMEVMTGDSDYNKVVITRSVVPTRDMGFLPGSAKDKAQVYEAPYYGICSELFERGDAYSILKSNGTVEFQTTSFIRGLTYNNCIIIVDEMQNCTYQELDTVITRLGTNCKIIFCGDFKQTDLQRDSEKRGLLDFMRILRKMNKFENIEFNHDDIVRSDLVKQYIIAKEELSISY